MRSAAPRRNARPPIPVPGAVDRTPANGTRRTVSRRPMIRPRVWDAAGGYPARDEYVRRYWTAAVGAGAVADLLRVVQAAKLRRSIRRPENLTTLARVGLVVQQGSNLYVRSTVPPVPYDLWSRLTPGLRRELRHITETNRRRPGGGPGH